MTALHRLLEHGQSFWLDDLTRGMVQRGELAERIHSQGLRGVTSNPAIFRNAIVHGREYDEDIAHFVANGLSTVEIYDRLTVADVQGACDVLRSVWQESGGLDGYVSLEVSPHLAHDTMGTISEAQRLWDAIGRENAFIKIPGTPAGVPAIRESIIRGINVNVTLLFSIAAYEAVAVAYLEGLEARRDSGQSVDDVISVASFFLSRIDSLTDTRLAALADAGGGTDVESLFGQAAVANAKLAYGSFSCRLASERWKSLEADGARPQRMLWASTSTKNPSYSDLKYVEPLIGPLTINTMPESTIAAFEDHGEVCTTVGDGLREAAQTMERLEEAGISFEDITDTLLVEGIRKFVEPYDALLEEIDARGKNLTR